MIFAFGDHELDDERFELRRNGRALSIQPKTFQLLLHLVRNRDRIVTKREILETVWQDSVVTDGSLARSVSLARLAIGDRGREPATIVTVPRRGYAFRAPVSEIASRARAATEAERATRYIGREQLRARVVAALDAALAGAGRIVFIAGEAGIGKTRTAQLLAAHAQRAGALAVTAWGLEAGAPTYGAWARALRALAGAAPQAVAQLAPAQRGALARLVPELGADAPPAPAPDATRERDSFRFQLHDAAQSLLELAARARPVALFLDDLHDADAESLWLLEALGQGLGALPIAIVVTCREDEAGRVREHARALERLLRVPCLERWRLTGLRGDEIRDFVQARLGGAPDPELVAALERKTGGNPLLLGESLRSLEARGLLGPPRTGGAWEALLPSGIQHLLEPKLRRLSPGALEVLRCAAAIGLEFEHALLERCAPPGADLARALDELEGASILHASGAAGRVRFPHALVRDALDTELTPPGDARRALHARIAAALDAQATASDSAHAERAHHACEAVPLVDPARAAALARVAAQRAALLHDFEGAATWYGRGLAALELAPSDAAARAALHLGLAAAQRRAIGLEPARQSYRRAAECARELRQGELLARAALGFAHRPNSSGHGDREAIELLEEAMGALARGNEALRIRLLSRLAAEIRYEERARAEALADAAIAAARELGDAAVLAQALDDASYVRWSPADAKGWIALNGEVVRAAQASNDMELVLEGMKGRVTGYLELGDIVAVDQEIAAFERVAELLRTPYARWLCAAMRAMRALLAGDLEAAERRVGDSIRLGEKVDSAEVALELLTQLVSLRLEQGRGAEIEAAARAQVERFPDVAAWRAALGKILCASGRADLARHELEWLARRRFDDVPRDRGWLPTLALASEVACATGDARTAEALEEILAPYAPLAVVAGTGVLYYGSVSHHLGLLASTRSAWDAAVARFESALADEERSGARVWAARTRIACARALLSRDAGPDRARAARLAAEALDVARSRGLTAVLDEARALESALWSRGRVARTRRDGRPR